MSRRALIAGVGVLAFVAAGAALTPKAVQRYGEYKVDQALKQIGQLNTSFVGRGKVSVDIGAWAVTVRDLRIESPGGVSKVSIGALTMTKPADDNGRLTADRVSLDRVSVQTATNTTNIPRIDLVKYSGSARGLIATPGIGASARSQADVISLVSLESASVPSVDVSEDITKITRRIQNVSVGRIKDGVIERVTIETAKVNAPDLHQGQPVSDAAFELNAQGLVYEGLNLPTLWRFYASDGAGTRAPLANRLSASRISASFGDRATWRVNLSADQAQIKGVSVRPLSYTIAEIDQLIAKARFHEALTPADIRKKCLIAVDASKAIAIDGVALTGFKAALERNDGRKSEWSAASINVGPYADGRIGSVALGNAAFTSDGASGAIGQGEAVGLDGSGLVAYAERVGADKTLLTATPTAADVVRLSPRIGRAQAQNVSFKGRAGELAVAQSNLEVDAPAEIVPQHLALKMSGVDLAPAKGSWLEDTLKKAELDRLRGSAAFSVTLDPKDEKLSLDQLDYKIEGFGDVTAKGALSKVDPAIVIATGLGFFDKLSAVQLEPVKVTAKNDGAAEALFQRIAEKSNEPREAFRENLALMSQKRFVDILGPSAARSGDALADFIRDPRSIEVTVMPKDPSTPLIDLLQSIDLGPEGIAQTIDVRILNKR